MKISSPSKKCERKRKEHFAIAQKFAGNRLVFPLLVATETWALEFFLSFQEAKVMATCLYTSNAVQFIHMKCRSFAFIIVCPDASEIVFIDETILSSRPETSMVGFLFSLEKSTERRELAVFELVVSCGRIC